MLPPKKKLTFDEVFSKPYLTKAYHERFADARFIGVDGISSEAFEPTLENEVGLIEKKVLAGKYKFTRYREKLILKSANKPPRQISIPTIRDALVLRAICDLLTSLFPESRMRPPHDCTKRVLKAVESASEDHSFLRMDVVNFYPTINHDILFGQLSKAGTDKRLVALIRAAITSPTGFDTPLTDGVGVPQGLSISNILSMIYLTEFDAEFQARYDFFRYVDDVLVLSKSADAAKVHDEIAAYMKSVLKLETHELKGGSADKTSIMPIDTGTEFLGYHVSKNALRIRNKSYKKMFRAIVGCLRPLKGKAKADQLIWRLNLIVTGCRVDDRSVGWVFFFRQSTDIGQFHRMDNFVQKQLKTYGLADHASRVKRFAKTYHEIRYNRDKTQYIPDFDNFTLADMIKAISLVKGFSEKRLGEMDRSQVEEIYWSMIRREVAKLERETVDFSTSSS